MKSAQAQMCIFSLGDLIHIHGFNHSSYANSQVFISSRGPFLSPVPYLHCTQNISPWMSAGALNLRDPMLNSSASCLNVLLCPDSPSPPFDPLNTQVRTWGPLASSPCPSLCSSRQVTMSSNSTSYISHRSVSSFSYHGNGPKCRPPFVTGLPLYLPQCSLLLPCAPGTHSLLARFIFARFKSDQSPPPKTF